MARKQKPYQATWNEVIVGLSRDVDGRWRLTGTQKRWTEPDERKAVEQAKRMLKLNRPMVNIPMVVKTTTTEIDEALVKAMAGQFDPPTEAPRAVTEAVQSTVSADGEVSFSQQVDEAVFWRMCRERIDADPVKVAKALGLPPSIFTDTPTASSTPLALDAIADLYAAKSEATKNTIGHVRASINRLKKLTGTSSLPELSTEKLLAFREATCKSLAPSGAAALFGKIKSALAFAAKKGADSPQITACLGRMKVLSAPKATSRPEPKPITPAEFHKLLAVANPRWRATLLLGLNMAMYIEDICTLQWSDFDLGAATFVGRRAKTQVIRVGVLWAETLAALKAIPHRGQSPYVFTSAQGTRFNGQRAYNDYKELREKAGVDAPFSSLRDAAYTIACRSCEDRISRVFAGHRMAGLMDSYIQRNPEWVKPAANAVYATFGPFLTPHHHVYSSTS